MSPEKGQAVVIGLLRKRQSSISHPQAVFIQLNTRCNAHCVNCPYPATYGKRARHEAMSDQVWEAIIDDLRCNHYQGQVGLYLHFEPLLEPTLMAKIREVNERTEAFVVLSTNGYSLTPERSRELVAAGPRQVHININSGDAAQYERMTGLKLERTLANAQGFIREAKDKVAVEINCPVMEETDTDSLVGLFPGTKVNIEYWANSRGGLVDDLHTEAVRERQSRFKLADRCTQPAVNLNILHDGRYLLCCMDWAHESAPDLPTALEVPPIAAYNSEYFRDRLREFERGDYSKYRMCQVCSEELGFR